MTQLRQRENWDNVVHTKNMTFYLSKIVQNYQTLNTDSLTPSNDFFCQNTLLHNIPLCSAPVFLLFQFWVHSSVTSSLFCCCGSVQVNIVSVWRGGNERKGTAAVLQLRWVNYDKLAPLLFIKLDILPQFP